VEILYQKVCGINFIVFCCGDAANNENGNTSTVVDISNETYAMNRYKEKLMIKRKRSRKSKDTQEPSLNV
jgi:hypothetical protein